MVPRVRQVREGPAGRAGLWLLPLTGGGHGGPATPGGGLQWEAAGRLWSGSRREGPCSLSSLQAHSPCNHGWVGIHFPPPAPPQTPSTSLTRPDPWAALQHSCSTLISRAYQIQLQQCHAHQTRMHEVETNLRLCRLTQGGCLEQKCWFFVQKRPASWSRKGEKN